METGADSAFSAISSHYFLWKKQHETFTGVNHDSRERLLRQQRETEFLETGSVYVMKTGGFLAEKHRFFGRIGIHEISRDRWLEIDEAADLVRAEYIIGKIDA